MAKLLFEHKETFENGEMIEIRVYELPSSEKQPIGVAYSMVFIKNNSRVVGYDNFEGHVFQGSSHHRHIKERILPYEFVDIWKAIEDFCTDVEKWRNLQWK